MKLIVGLGNPGKEYDKTRHNIGFNVLDIIADQYNLSFNENKKFNALEVIFNIMNEKIILIKPLTFMNLSGDCVVKYVNYYNINSLYSKRLQYRVFESNDTFSSSEAFSRTCAFSNSFKIRLERIDRPYISIFLFLITILLFFVSGAIIKRTAICNPKISG